MSFDEKQQRRDKWNKKRTFRKKDRFKNKKSTKPFATEDPFDPNLTVVDWDDQDVDIER